MLVTLNRKDLSLMISDSVSISPGIFMRVTYNNLLAATLHTLLSKSIILPTGDITKGGVVRGSNSFISKMN